MKYLLPILFLCLGTGCKYSFRGISIPPGVKSFYVNFIENEADNVEATMRQDFTNNLQLRIRTESPLNEVDTDPDVEFKGRITQYRVSSEAPSTDEEVAFNRISMSVAMEYLNNVNPEEEAKKKTFSTFRDFETTVNLLDVQDQLITEMNSELADLIFQWAFTNW